MTPGDVSARPALPTPSVARARGSVAAAGAGRAPRPCLARVSAPSPLLARQYLSPGPEARLRTGPGWSLPPHPAPGAPLGGAHPAPAFSRPRRGSGPGGSLKGLRQLRVRASASLRLLLPPSHTPPPSARLAQRRRTFHLPGGSHLGLQTPAKRGWRGGISDGGEAR